MSYDFKNLSSADFEDLVRDLIGKKKDSALRHSAQAQIVVLTVGTRTRAGTLFYRPSIMKVRRSAN
jgi:hypothetical protein